jgi:nonsense-mediated mRNA decay protein 3
MDEHRILCCECAVPIEPNAVNMCVNCLQERYDIGAGVSKQVQQNTCRGCNRFERRDGSWAEVELESKELLALLLKKPRGLTQVRLVDASYVWTEPHSKRIKLKLVVQKEVVVGAVLQQSFIVEFVIGNKQCGICQRREAKDTWVSVCQVRQKVEHKRTFFWIEQLILKHRAHVDAINIVERRDGLDFFYGARSHAEKMCSFLQGVAPTRYKASKQLISTDTHTGMGRYKFTFSVEILPICRGDALWLPVGTAQTIGQMPRFMLCDKVSNLVHMIDPRTLKRAELLPLTFWKKPFTPALTRAMLIEYVVLDIELESRPSCVTVRGGGGSSSGGSGRKKRSMHNDALADGGGDKAPLSLAEVTVARRDEFGVNDRTFRSLTHLGNVLRVGDFVWGYAVDASPLPNEVSHHDAEQLPEVVLVKKSYSERRRKPRTRAWKLQSLQKEEDESEWTVQRGRKIDVSKQEQDYEEFMQDLEEDPAMRAQINLYKDTAAMEARAQAAKKRALKTAGTESDSELGADDEDFPEVGLEELLDELTLGADDEDDVLPDDQVQAIAAAFEPGLRIAGQGTGPHTLTSSNGAQGPLSLPDGHDPTVKFYF